MINEEEIKYETFKEIKEYFTGVEALKYNGQIDLETVCEIFFYVDKYYDYSRKIELSNLPTIKQINKLIEEGKWATARTKLKELEESL